MIKNRRGFPGGFFIIYNYNYNYNHARKRIRK